MQNMARYQLYSAGKGPVAMTKNCPIPEYNLYESPSPPVNKQNIPITRGQIDYSRFVNDISSRRRPSQLREICNYLYNNMT